jgi:hypothetical protein
MRCDRRSGLRDARARPGDRPNRPRCCSPLWERFPTASLRSKAKRASVVAAVGMASIGMAVSIFVAATTTVMSHNIALFPVGLMDQSIRALGSVKAVADDSCTNSTRAAAAPRAITVTAKHATMKTRMIFLQLPRQIQRTCPETWSVKALVSISTNVRPSAPTRA